MFFFFFFGPLKLEGGKWIEVAEVPMEAPEWGMPPEMMLAIHQIFLDSVQTRIAGEMILSDTFISGG